MILNIESNILQVVQNFEKQIREQPLIVKKALGRTAEYLMFLIKKRTGEGKDYQGNNFVKYTSEYAKIRQAKGRQISYVDLNFSGQMLSSITQRSTPSFAIIYFASKFQNIKALGNQKKRKFFAIGDKEVIPLTNMFMKEFNKLSALQIKWAKENP